MMAGEVKEGNWGDLEVGMERDRASEKGEGGENRKREEKEIVPCHPVEV